MSKIVIFLEMPFLLLAQCDVNIVEPFYTLEDYIRGTIPLLLISLIIWVFVFGLIPNDENVETRERSENVHKIFATVVSLISFLLMLSSTNFKDGLLYDNDKAKDNAFKENQVSLLKSENSACVSITYRKGWISIEEVVRFNNKSNDAHTDYILYKAYLKGDKVFKDIEKSEFHLNRSAKNKGGQASLILAKRYTGNDNSLALYYYDIVLDSGHRLNLLDYINVLNNIGVYSDKNIKLLSEKFPEHMCAIAKYAYLNNDHENGGLIAKSHNCKKIWKEYN